MGGSEGNLFELIELLAIDKGLIGNKISVVRCGWNSERAILSENKTTNFNKCEIERIFEAFHLLLNNHIIAPGISGKYSRLPSFHITEHGKQCIALKDILPYI